MQLNTRLRSSKTNALVHNILRYIGMFRIGHHFLFWGMNYEVHLFHRNGSQEWFIAEYKCAGKTKTVLKVNSYCPTNGTWCMLPSAIVTARFPSSSNCNWTEIVSVMLIISAPVSARHLTSRAFNYGLCGLLIRTIVYRFSPKTAILSGLLTRTISNHFLPASLFNSKS